MYFFKNKNGFTLIEVLFVVGIVAFLAIGAFNIFSGGTDKARVKAVDNGLSVMESSVKNYKGINNKYPYPSDSSGNVLSNGVIGVLANNQGFANYVENFSLDTNGILEIEGNPVFYGVTVDGSYYVLGTIVKDPTTGNDKNVIKTNYPYDIQDWTLFNDTNEVIVNGTEDPLLSDIVLDGSVYVSQGFTVVKQDSDTLRIKLTAPLGTATADEAATEALFTLNGLSFGDNTALDAGTSVIELKVAGDIDVAQDSIQLAGAATLDNPNNLITSTSFGERTVLNTLLGRIAGGSGSNEGGGGGGEGEGEVSLVSYFVELFSDGTYENSGTTTAEWVGATLASTGASPLSPSDEVGTDTCVSCTDNPNNLTLYDNKLYFAASDQDGDMKLHSYDPVNDYVKIGETSNNTGGVGDSISDMIVYNDKLYFSAYDMNYRKKLHSYDTTNGLQTIEGPYDNIENTDSPTDFVALGDTIYYEAFDGTGYAKLFKFDESEGVITQISNTRGVGSTDSVQYITSFNGDIYFRANNNYNRSKIYYYDPDTDTLNTSLNYSTGSVSQNDNPTYVTRVGSRLYMGAMNSSGQYKFHSYDPVNGYVQLPDISGSSSESISTIYGDETNNIVYLSANDSNGHRDLFRYDLTNGLQEIDTYPGGSDFPSQFGMMGGNIYFRANDTNGYQKLHEYNPTTDTLTKLGDTYNATAHDQILYPTAIGSVLYFSAYDSSGRQKLHSYDSVNGIQKLGDTRPGSSDSLTQLIAIDNTLYFGAFNSSVQKELYSYDSVNGFQTLGSTNSGSDGVAISTDSAQNGKLYYLSINASGQNKLHEYDPGTGLITQVPGDIADEPANTGLGEKISIGSNVYIVLQDQNNIRKIYLYDGSNNLTKIGDSRPAGKEDYPRYMVEYDGKLFMSMYNGSNQFKLFSYDESNGFQLISNTNPGSHDSPQYLTTHNNVLYFTASASYSGKLHSYEPINGVQQLTELRVGNTDNITYITGSGNYLYFSGLDSSGYSKLHRYNITDQTMTKLGDTSSAGVNDVIINLEALDDGTILFRANNSSNLSKLFGYDETNGLRQMGESYPSQHEYPNYLYADGNTLYYQSRDTAGRYQMHTYDSINGIQRVSGETATNRADSPAEFTDWNGVFYFKSYTNSGHIELFAYSPSGSYDTANNLLVSTDVAGGEEMSGSEILVNATTPAGTSYDLEVSDNGSDWTMIANDQTGNLPQVATNITGTSFYWRITLNGTTSSAPTISRVEILK